LHSAPPFPSPACSLCHASRDNELLLQACLGRGQFSGAREVVLLQASNSFFAYEPILKALQRMTVLPMAHYLVPGLAGPGEMPSPRSLVCVPFVILHDSCIVIESVRCRVELLAQPYSHSSTQLL
jgi:hypothetical protein